MISSHYIYALVSLQAHLDTFEGLFSFRPTLKVRKQAWQRRNKRRPFVILPQASLLTETQSQSQDPALHGSRFGYPEPGFCSNTMFDFWCKKRDKTENLADAPKLLKYLHQNLTAFPERWVMGVTDTCQSMMDGASRQWLQL